MNDSSTVIQYVLAGLFVLIMVVASLYIYSNSEDPQSGFLNRENSRTVVSSARDDDRDDFSMSSSRSSLDGAPRFRDEETLPSREGTASGLVSNYSGRSTYGDQEELDSRYTGWQSSTYSNPYGYEGTRSSSRREYTDWPAGSNYTNRSASQNARLQRGRWRDMEPIDDDRTDRSTTIRRERDMSPEERLADADIDQSSPEGRLEAACILNDGSRYQCRCLMREVRRELSIQEINFISRPEDNYGPASRLREAGIPFDEMPDLAVRIVALDAQAQRRCRVGLPYAL